MENKFYSSDRIWSTIVVSIVVFMLVFAAVTDGFDDSPRDVFDTRYPDS